MRSVKEIGLPLLKALLFKELLSKKRLCTVTLNPNHCTLSSGTLPSGTLPSGTLSSGTLPSGTLPSASGTLPSGTLPSGTIPSGTLKVHQEVWIKSVLSEKLQKSVLSAATSSHTSDIINLGGDSSFVGVVSESERVRGWLKVWYLAR